MDALARLLLVRHPETDWNAERRWQGHSDQPLNVAGRKAMREVLELAGAEGVSAIYTSDLVRAHETAAWVGAVLKIEPRVTDRLRERAMGEWEGLTADEVAARLPADVAAREADPFRFAPRGGESLEAVLRRVEPLLRSIANLHPGTTVLVVTHGGVMRALLYAILPPELARRETAFGNGGYVLVEPLPSGWRILKPEPLAGRPEGSAAS